MNIFEPSHLIIILLIAVLLFGGRKIPELMRGIGQGVGELQKGLDEGKKVMSKAVEEVKATPAVEASDDSSNSKSTSAAKSTTVSSQARDL